MQRIAKITLIGLTALAAGGCTARVMRSMPSPEPIVYQRTTLEVAEAAAEPQESIQFLPPHPLAGLIAQSVQTSTRWSAIPECNIAAEALKDDPGMDGVELTVGTKFYRYIENRGKRATPFKDEERQIALRTLDTTTCLRETVIITKRGDQLIAPKGWDIEAVTRTNGIRWNNWATEYRVSNPPHKVVIRNRFPHTIGEGKRRQIVYIDYVSYSRDLHLPVLVNEGRTYMMDLATRAKDELRTLGVPSHAIAGTLLVDTPVAVPAWLARLGPIEHMDLGEFILDQNWSVQHALIRIGANRETFASFTCNRSGACGLMQFTDNSAHVKGKLLPGTYTALRRAYPEAKLIADFTEGARDQLNAMKAAYLHHDDVLRKYLNTLGVGILADPLVLEELVGGGYNAGATPNITAYQRATKKKVADWTQALAPCKKRGQAGCMPTETLGYVAKLRYLRQVWDTPRLALTDQTPD